MPNQLYQNMLAEMRMIGAENAHHIGIYIEHQYQIYMKLQGTRATKEENKMLLAEIKKFNQCRKNIEHAAANLIQTYLIQAIDHYKECMEKEAEEDYSDYSTDSNIEAAKQAEELYLSNNGWEDPYRKWPTEEWEKEPYLDCGRW